MYTLHCTNAYGYAHFEACLCACLYTCPHSSAQVSIQISVPMATHMSTHDWTHTPLNTIRTQVTVCARAHVCASVDVSIHGQPRTVVCDRFDVDGHRWRDGYEVTLHEMRHRLRLTCSVEVKHWRYEPTDVESDGSGVELHTIGEHCSGSQ